MKYEKPNMDIIVFTVEDVITTSDTESSLVGGNDGTGDTHDPVKDLGW